MYHNDDLPFDSINDASTKGLNSKPIVEIEADPEEDLMDAASLNKKPLGLSATIHRIRVIVKSSSSTCSSSSS